MNSKELVAEKTYSVEGGKKNVCKVIRDLMDDSRMEALIESARNLLDVLSDEVIAEKIGLPLEKVQELRREAQQ